jgi:hypothetical protein
MSAVATPSAIPYSTSAPTNVKRSILIGTLEENGKSLDVLGFIAFWNVKEVEFNHTQFVDALVEAGIDTKYAKEHNARSALIRALAFLKEKKIVRTTHEDDIYTTVQFTAEVKKGNGTDAQMEYHPQVSITIDKALYGSKKNKDTKAFRNAIVHVRDIQTGEEHADSDVIKDQLDLAFGKAITSYTSHDLTRYIQNIFADQADIVSLRQQGSVYFVPAAYKPVVDGIRILVERLGGAYSRFDSIPMPDTKDSRKAVGDSFTEEVIGVLSKLDTEVKEMNASSKDITDKWVAHRRATILKIQNRINMYADVLGGKAAEMRGTIDELSGILQARTLEI